RLPEFDSAAYNQTAILNVSEELDIAGEYWVDSNTMTMYVYAPSGTYTFPSVARGVDMHYCDYITFRGLTMTAYSEHIVKALECSGITFDLCRITACSGANAIYIDGNHGDLDYDLTVTECEFSVLAEKALRANGYCWGYNKFDHRGNVLFDNNRVTFSHLVSDGGCAVEIEYTNEAVVSHNEFEDLGRGAVAYSGSCNAVIEYNTFKHCMYNSQDGGVIYSWNHQYDWGNVVQYNVFYPASNWYGLYIDDAEPGTEVRYNLFYEVGAAVCIHNGRSNFIHDNYMIESGVAYATGDIAEQLAQYKIDGDASKLSFYSNWVNFFNTLDGDPALKEAYFSLYPELSALTTDLSNVDDPNFVLYPRNYVRNNYYFSYDGAAHTNDDPYCVVEGNVMLAMDDNPCFVNPAVGDYRIIEGSEFPDIHFEEMGRY
ncbi:MAG: right-handed parallel beta-helix repeat-containing protein, partial [Clostridia bacterium]|nr:right-handed parallel beta-helix repeat-containing protein [Clostridia bacterium]